jgi:hypothetical protein
MTAAAQAPSPPSRDLASRPRWGTAGEKWLASIACGMRLALGRVRQLAPYAAIELVLPGGTLLAILLWLYRRRQRAREAALTGPASPDRSRVGMITGRPSALSA